MNHAGEVERVTFDPCRRRECAHCTGAYVEGDRQWTCICPCHDAPYCKGQLSLTKVVRVQRDLFGGSEDK